VSRTQPILVVTIVFLMLAGLVGYVSASAFHSQEQSRGVVHKHTPLF
jgi:hypothetical protein